MIAYIKRLLEQMRVNDDLYQIHDTIQTLATLVRQNKSVSSKTICDAIDLIEELQKDFDNVTKEKH